MCEHLFRVREATKSPTDQASQSQPTATDVNTFNSPYADPSRPVAAEPVTPTILPATVVKPEDISQYYVNPNISNAPAGNRPSYGPSKRHVSSPWMVPAILAAIFVPLILGCVCLCIYAVRTVGAVAKLQDERVRQARHSAAKESFGKRSEAPNFEQPNVGQRGSDPIEQNRNGFADRNGPRKSNTVPPTREEAEAKVAADKARMEEMKAESKRRAEKSKAERETRMLAMKERQKEYEAKRAKDKQAREERYAKRAETKRLAEIAKTHLNKMESEADLNPRDGMVARMEIQGWGAKQVAVSNDGMMYAVTPDKLLVYDIKKKRSVNKLDKLQTLSRFNAVCLNQDGSILAVGGEGGKIELLKVRGRGKLKTFRVIAEHERDIDHLAFNSTGTRLMSLDLGGVMCIWDLDKEEYLTKKEHERRLQTFLVDDQQNTITLAYSKKWHTVNFENGEELKSGEFPFSFSGASAYTRDGSRMLSSLGSRVRVFELDKKDEMYQLKSNGVQWTIASLNQDEFLVGGNRHFYRWNWKTKELLKVWSLPDTAYIQKISVSPDGSLVAVGKGSTSDPILVFELNDN
ncbi:hypothetical protein N9Y42_03455 [Mariniblastus sp.]|nr:hypothetical protein [Mariniblastus sp.]